MVQIGITERGDAAINTDWKTWVYSFNKPAILITKNPIKLIEENQELFFGYKGNVILHKRNWQEDATFKGGIGMPN